MDTDVRWFSMPVAEQISNVGSEVNRAIKWKNRNDVAKAENFCKKAIEFLQIMMRDPKNQGRVGELREAVTELEDCFLGDNEYQTTAQTLTRYYDAFLYRI